MKKVISLFLSLAMLLSIVSVVDFSAYASVETGKCGDKLKYSLDTSTGLLTISGTGDMYDYGGSSYSPFKNYYSSSIKSVIIKNGVTSIGEYAFCNCTSLTSITIPNSVTSICYSAFYGCTSLTSITIPDSVTSIGGSAFSGCTSLTNITIPNSVTSIGNNAFRGCTSLTNVTIPDSVTSIGEYAFCNCTSLTSVTIPNSVTNIGVSAFSSCTSLTLIDVSKNNKKYISIDGVLFDKDKTKLIQYPAGSNRTIYSIPNSVISIGSDAFVGCTSLTSVTIPDSVTSIGSGAFRSCTSLTSVKIPNSVTSIGNYTFSGCTSLTSITISDSVKSIGWNAFSGCTSLTSVTIPNSVTSIDNNAFRGCTNLTIVTIPNSVTSIGGYAFSKCTNLTSIDVEKDNSNYSSQDGVLFNKDKTRLIQYPIGNKRTTYNIPNNVTSIELYAFSGCTNLTSITISNSITNIGNSAFRGCTSLVSVTIPDSVTSIDVGAFEDCTSLTSITIPNSVISIQPYAFQGCTSLTSVTIPDSVTSIGDYIFQGCTSLTSVTIPDSVTSIGDHAFDCCTSLTSVTISDSVKSIGDYAFSSCENLTSVTIPGSVTSIGRSTFYNCTSLTSIDYNGTVSQWKSIKGYGNVSKIIKCTDGIIGNGNTVTIDNLKYKIYDDTASLVGYVDTPENLMIPKSFWYDGYTFKVSSIGVEAFYNCTSLTSVTIPNSVTSIGSSALSGCSNLKSVNYNGTKAQWKSISGYGNVSQIIKCTDGIYANSNTIIIDSVKYRLNDDYTAEVISYSGTPGNITILESVTYEGLTFKVTSIGSSAFSNCTSLKSATIPDSVASIGDSAFSGCTSLTSVTIPNSVESIGDNAFQNCSSLTSATIGNNVTSIGSSAFFGCSKLKKIEIPDSVTYIGSKAFDGTAFYNTVKNWEDGVLYCGNHLISAKSDVTKITVKASTVSIAAGALDNCKSLEKINVLNPKCVINCTIPKTAVIGGAEGSTAEDFAQKNNMSIDYFEECTHSDKVQVVIAATCTEQGAVQSRCADCDKLISQTFTAPLGHTMVITTPAKAPTCTTSGNTQAGYCTVCGYNEVSTVIPATGHNFGNNSANCLVCGVANPNYVAPTQPTPSPTPSATPTQPNQNDTNTSNGEDVTVISKPKSASIKKIKAAKKAVSVEWKKVSGVKGYQVQVATDKKFKKNKKTVTVKKQKTTKTTVKKLKAKKKYYVRIRTYKIANGKKVYSSWSKVKTVKTK